MDEPVISLQYLFMSACKFLAKPNDSPPMTHSRRTVNLDDEDLDIFMLRVYKSTPAMYIGKLKLETQQHLVHM